MGVIRTHNYPIMLELIHDDVVVEIDPETGQEYYTVERIDWEERAGQTWNVTVFHPVTGNPVPTTITPFEVGFKNIPPPARFATDCNINAVVVAG